MDIKLCVNIYYEPVEMLKSYLAANTDLYVPVNCGNLKIPNASEWCKKYVKFEDDSNSNIAHYNAKFNENTAIWWFWKNYGWRNCDYVGHQHYRRFFCQQDFQDISKYDIVVQEPHPMRFNLSFFTHENEPHVVETNVRNGYCICHKEADFNLMEKLVKSTRYGIWFEEWQEMKELFAPCMMFIMKPALFDEWCNFAFPILFELEKQIDLTGRDGYQRRAIAFLAERMFSLFAFSKLKEGLKIKNIGTMFFDSFKPESATDKRGMF